MMLAAVLVLVAGVGACAKKKPPIARPTPPPPAATPTNANRPPAPPQPVAEPQPVPAEPTISSDPLAASDIDAINKNSPFQPVFYGFDMAELDEPGQQVLSANAGVLRKYPAWVVTIEGHADERGTAEYNLALGERRANAVKSYLVGLGVPAERMTVVSKGKESPACTESTESCWQQNRRGHGVVTAK